MQKATLCFLIKDNRILLGMKKRGFGVGLWNGCGGKVHEEDGESVEEATIRETQEEFGVRTKGLKLMAELTFSFPHKLDWGQVVYVYLCHDWTGEPSESEEMRPQWFENDKLPFDKMWADDPYWIPKILNGEFVKAMFEFNEDGSVSKHKFFKP